MPRHGGDMVTGAALKQPEPEMDAAAIPPGYQQTELGVIPEDWEVKTLADFEPFVTSGSRGWAAFYSESGQPFIRITNMQRYEINLNLENLKYVKVSANSSEGTRTELKDGDLLISITADIGIVSYVNGALLKPSYINQHIALVRFNRPNVDSKYVAYYLTSNAPQKTFLGHTDQGAKAGMNLATIRKIQFVYPPLPEQQAIAEALSDVDGWVAALEALIAKKRDLKTAAMQQLLTGKTRLPGFSGEWEEKKLGDLGIFLKGGGIRKDEALSGNLPCVRYGEIYTIHNDYVRQCHSSISHTVATTATRLCEGDILFAGSGETKAEIGKCVAFIHDYEAYAGGDIVILRPQRTCSLFLGYYLNISDINRKKASKGQGDAVVHISSSALAGVDIKIPKTLEEQTAIAAILSDMDAEIAVLEAERDKARAIKQGMMQELLTGKTRLI